MTGIIRFDPADRVSRRVIVTRAAAGAVAGSTGLALMLDQVRGAAAQTPEASPMARGGTYMADARERLRDLLGFVPASSMQVADPSGQLFDWVDYDARFAAFGITDPYADGVDIVAATLPLVTSDPLLNFAMVPDIVDLIGFRPFDIHQVLVAGAPPDRLVLYRGGIDTADMPAFWESAGYKRKTGTYGDYWTIGEQGELDLQNPLQQIAMANLNNIAILDDTTIACTSFYARLETALALAAGEEEAATGNEQLGQLIDVMPEDTVSVMALPGEHFLATSIVPENPGMESSTTIEDLLAESDDAVGPMPALVLSLCGVTAGAGESAMSGGDGTPNSQGNPDGHAFMSFLTGSGADAATAAEVAYWRLENMISPTTGQVYADRFIPSTPVEEAVEGEVMVVRFSGEPAARGNWRDMIYSRDTWPFAWLPVS